MRSLFDEMNLGALLRLDKTHTRGTVYTTASYVEYVEVANAVESAPRWVLVTDEALA